MQLELSTWQEVEAYLERARGILIPIGSTEQHGPNGLIGTDSICAETVARGVAEELDVMVAPTLPVGMAQHHLGFPGTISLRPATLIAVVVDMVSSLARHGFDRLFFLNGHGGNVSSLNAAFSEVYAAGGTAGEAGRNVVRCTLKNWWMGRETRALSDQLFGEAEGHHATPSEISLSYFAHPEAVKSVAMHPKLAPRGPIRDAQDYRRRFPDGRIGSDPTLATVAAGESIFRAAVAEVAASYRGFTAGD